MELKLRISKPCSEEVVEETEGSEPVSPTGQYFNSSVLSISILAVLDFDTPIDNFPIMSVLEDVFLPINPRFSSLMITDKEGIKKWKKVQVKLEDHVTIPTFPTAGLSSSYDDHLNSYLTKIAMESFPQNRPLWEIHLIKYKTSTGAGHFIFKLHHALGDGFSLMGALLSCLQRADNSPHPLTFPRFSSAPEVGGISRGVTKRMVDMVPKFLFGAYYSICDLGWSVLKSTLAEDDKTLVRSGDEAVEFRPVAISTLIFGLEQIKQIKTKLRVTINDVITGIVFLGTRMYMQGRDTTKSSSISETTALVLLNTRNIGGYKSVEEMVKTDGEDKLLRWGNQFAFLHTSVPELLIKDDGDDDDESLNPLSFVFQAREMIKRKRNSLAVHLTGHILEALRKYAGPEVTAKHIHKTLRNSSMTMSNLIGPVEQMAVLNHPVRGLYFMVVGVPQSLTITIMSYAQNLRIAVGVEKGFIDLKRFNSCVNTAYDLILAAANKVPYM